MQKYEIETYITKTGNSPFQEWINALKDDLTKTKLLTRIERARYGLFGDSKAIKGAQGIFEMREHYGAGYRIYYSTIKNRIVLLLAGSDKRDQKKAIAKAKAYLEDYKQETNP